MTRTLTAEQKAAKADQNKAWRKRNPEKIRAYEAKYRAAAPEKNKAKNKAYYAANAQKRLAAAREWAAANPERVRARQNRLRWQAAGIDPIAAEVLRRTHRGVCDCCGRTKPGGRWGWNLDHCHDTGRIRGILCHNCNTAIGKLGDNLEGVMNAVRYLEKGAVK